VPETVGCEHAAVTKLRTVCVYCGSSPGRQAGFAEAAAALGRTIARRGMTLVYGGAQVGLMGVVADAAIDEGGEVHGVITRGLETKEIAHRGLTHLDVVDTMHERKAAMADLTDGFVMLPGGFGTFDEFFEAVTWTQLGVHDKPCGVLDVGGYFDPLEALLDNATAQGFVRGEHRGLVMVDDDADTLLDRMAAWEPVVIDKWIDRSDV
jgi:uncharacterized protein (TIGR00730 family)